MMPWIYAAIASTIVVGSGILHGLWTDRWARSDETTKAREALASIPLTIGDWVGKDLDRSSPPSSGVTGSKQRTYTHKRTNVTVTIAIVNGRPGPVGTHTPEVCYGASGYFVGDKKPVGVEAGESTNQFWTCDAVRERVTDKTRIRLYWGWNGGNGWVASADARHEFPRHRHPILHKLYVVRDLNAATAGSKEEPCEEFLKEFVPALQASLFAG